MLVFGAYVFADGVLGHCQRDSRARRRQALVDALSRRCGWDRRRGRHGHLAGHYGSGPALLDCCLGLVTGGLEIAAAIRLSKVITGEWLFALIGIASIALGVMLALFPSTGALAVVIWIGAYALASGVLLMILSFRLRSWGKYTRSADLNPRTA